MKGENMRPEYVQAAAIWYKDFPKPAHGVKNCDTGVVLCGQNHAQIIHQHVTLMGKKQYEMGKYTQGFITSHNRFVDRKEAAEIAIRMKQVDPDKMAMPHIGLDSYDLSI